MAQNNVNKNTKNVGAEIPTDLWMTAMHTGALPSQVISSLAASSAMGFTLYSQWLGAVMAAAHGAPQSMWFNPLTFEWKRIETDTGSDAKNATSSSKSKVGSNRAADKTPTKSSPKSVEMGAVAITQKPSMMHKPESPDDLKLISGVGPKLEKVLNGLGVWTFEQVAAWTPAEIAWVDDFLQFSGRIERDKWIEQASRLSAKV
ncbi:MAG: NADH-ubiquinone dehydrogenase [Ahrensia sp.]|nr:NADH-ubiquinone dehydrogenase [Ahrensia sp.]